MSAQLSLDGSNGSNGNSAALAALQTVHSLSSSLHRARIALAKEQLNQELALRLLRPREKDRALLHTALIYLNRNNGRAVNRRIVSAVIEQSPLELLLRMIAADSEGAAIYNLVKRYMN